MVERDYTLDDEQLGERLRDFGRRQRYPLTPDLVPAVQSRIESRAGSRGGTPSWNLQSVAIGVTLLVLLCVAVLASPGARTTVAGWFDLPGVIFVSEPVAEPPALGGSLRLGESRTLNEARDAVSYDVLVPRLEWLGDPDEVYVDAEPVGAAVSFIYHASDELPVAETTGVGLLISQFQGQLNPGMYGKGLPNGVQLETLQLNGQTAFWISGEPHGFSYFDPDGQVVQETQRLAGNTLLWQHGDLTLRLESALDRDRAVQIAESMR